MPSIVSYNVNGIRAAFKKGLLDWVQEVDMDILCLQETKAQPEQVDTMAFAQMGYKSYLHSAEKKGYSGVAIFSKKEPDNIVVGCGIDKYDKEGRIIRADFGDWSVMNCYFPSGSSGDVRQDFKMDFLADFQNWINELREERPNLIVVGDYNIAHTENDIHNPKSNKDTSGFKPEEREWMTEWLGSGFTDAFRHLHPGKTEYSWWSYRAAARARNKGWRIDYQSVSNAMADKIQKAGHYNDAVHSDHCPVFMDIDLKY